MSSSMDDAFDGEGSGSSSSGSHCESGRELEYFGWVYHLGVNSIGHSYCHLRFLFLRGDSVAMYKRDPHQHPGIIPIRKGAISHTLMVEDLGRREVNSMELSVLRFYNRLDETKKGEIACASAREAKKWMEAFEQVKQQALHDLSMETARRKLNADGELNLEGHRRRVRHYAHGLKRLIRIGKGPEPLIRKTSVVKFTNRINPHSGVDLDDAIEAHDWKCARTVNGVRIFEDVANSKGSGTFLLKAVGIVDASVETVLEAILSLDTRKRHEWDVLTGELELLQLVDGQSDVVYGTYEPKNLNWWHSKKDFVFSRQWFRLQDGSCIILQIPAAHKKRPPRPGYQRIKISPSTWEIRKLSTSESSSKCLVTLMLEVHSSVWNRFKPDICSNFEKSISYGLLSQVEGLKQYFGANPSLSFDSLSIREYSDSSDSFISDDDDDSNLEDEFYDALAKVDSVEDEDSDDDNDLPKAGKMTLTDLSSVTASLDLKNIADMPKRSEMDIKISPTAINPDKFQGSLHQGKGESDTNCWTTPNGQGFMIRGKNYLTDNSKIVGGDPLLKLFAVDFLKAEKSIDNIALHPNCLVQSEAGKALPFILIINLQIPSKPYYSMVLYFGSERPISKESLLGRFVDGSDTFRDSRFKLIPSIVEGYWMVKRAVGTKACLLAKAVTCRYLRQDNFLEIDVDVGSSSVARTVIGLVLGYVTGLVVDLAILIEATEAGELPEYILGSVRLNRVSLDSVPSF